MGVLEIDGIYRPIRGGRSKKLYRLTPEGAAALSASRQMMARMADGLHLADGKIA